MPLQVLAELEIPKFAARHPELVPLLLRALAHVVYRFQDDLRDVVQGPTEEQPHSPDSGVTAPVEAAADLVCVTHGGWGHT